MQEPNTLRPAKELRDETEKRMRDAAKRQHDDTLRLVRQTINEAAKLNMFEAVVRCHLPESVIDVLTGLDYTVNVENCTEGATVTTISW